MSEVWRGGAKEMKNVEAAQGKRVSIPVKPWFYHKADGHVSLIFDIASKGGGRTSLDVRVMPDDFLRFAEQMVLADVKSAKAAFESALANPHRTSEEFVRQQEEKARLDHLKKLRQVGNE